MEHLHFVLHGDASRLRSVLFCSCFTFDAKNRFWHFPFHSDFVPKFTRWNVVLVQYRYSTYCTSIFIHKLSHVLILMLCLPYVRCNSEWFCFSIKIQDWNAVAISKWTTVLAKKFNPVYFGKMMFIMAITTLDRTPWMGVRIVASMSIAKMMAKRMAKLHSRRMAICIPNSHFCFICHLVSNNNT